MNFSLQSFRVVDRVKFIEALILRSLCSVLLEAEVALSSCRCYYVALEGWCLQLQSQPQTLQAPTVVAHPPVASREQTRSCSQVPPTLEREGIAPVSHLGVLRTTTLVLFLVDPNRS